MRPETLQSLSVGIVFLGLFLAALGGFGSFHFGQRVERDEEQQRVAGVQALAEVVSGLRQEQTGLLARVVTVEGQIADTPGSLASLPSFEAPPAIILPPTSQPSASFPLAPEPPPAMPDELLPHLPPVAAGPSMREEEPALAPPLQPPKLSPPPAAGKTPAASEKSAATEPPAAPVEEPSPAPAPTAPTISPSPAQTVASREEDGALTWQKRARLIKRLRNHPQHSIVIRAAAENAQAVKLAITLKSVFREAGWTVGEIEMISRPLPAHTLLLSTGVFPPPKEFVAAYAALAGTGFLVTSDLDPNQNRQRVVVSVGPIR